MSTRAIVNLPRNMARGQVVEVKATVAHPMETGHRRGSDGDMLARNIVRRLEARLNGELVFAADLFSAVSANPFVSFHLRATVAGTLVLTWRGDAGFEHRESLPFDVV